MDAKELYQKVIADVQAILFKAENALSAHNSGTLTVGHLHDVVDSANAAVTNAVAAAGEPQGTPVPDSGGEGQSSTAGTVPKPTAEQGTADENGTETAKK